MDSMISWVGGKKALREQIIARFPPGPLDRYIEVFGGAAWVLFGHDRHAKMEVYNDSNGQLTNLFRIAKYHAGELQRELAGYINSRELFGDALAQRDVRGLTDIQRAARFWLTIKLSYGSDVRSYRCSPARLDPGIEQLEAVRQRLATVVVEHKDFADLLKVYDRPTALIYCDPPYHGTEGHYSEVFGDADHRRLRDALGRVKGRFLLSYNDDSYIRDLYEGCTIEELQRPEGLSHKAHKGQRFRELLIRNY